MEKKESLIVKLKNELRKINKQQTELQVSRSKLSMIAAEENWIVNFQGKKVTDLSGNTVFTF